MIKNHHENDEKDETARDISRFKNDATVALTSS